jgi:non-heme chloroperoxidase
MNTFNTKDGTSIFYKDWGTGPVVTFSHGWPLSSDAWDAQMLFLGQQGYRVIAHDRRGHGRSGQTWQGNNLDQYGRTPAIIAAPKTSRRWFRRWPLTGSAGQKM